MPHTHFIQILRTRKVHAANMFSYKSARFWIAFAVCLCLFSYAEGQKCQVPASAPAKIEKVINQCQEEIKFAILTEALESLKGEISTPRRVKRDVFNDEEKRIAGCLLQCVYRKMKAVDDFGFPTVEGLLRIYSEGVTDQGYYLATLQAVQECLGKAQRKHVQKIQIENGKTCDVAYDTFECVSDTIGEYCGQRP